MRPPQRPPARKKRKDASFITLYNRQVNACLFFCLPLYYQVIQMPKRQFCLGSITKCHVIRTGGGFQRWGKKRPKAICNLSCKLPILRFGALHGVSFFGSWGRSQTTPSGLQGVDGICDASLASRDCTLSTGEHKRVRSRMNSSKRFTVRYIGLLPLLA